MQESDTENEVRQSIPLKYEVNPLIQLLPPNLEYG
jgi:hypothetical protein